MTPTPADAKARALVRWRDPKSHLIRTGRLVFMPPQVGRHCRKGAKARVQVERGGFVSVAVDGLELLKEAS